jgi:hypothetical protein
MEDRRDEADHRVLADHWAGLDPEQRQAAFPEEHRDDFGKGRTVQVAQEIFGRLAARLPDAARPEFLSKYPLSLRLDW